MQTCVECTSACAISMLFKVLRLCRLSQQGHGVSLGVCHSLATHTRSDDKGSTPPTFENRYNHAVQRAEEMVFQCKSCNNCFRKNMLYASIAIYRFAHTSVTQTSLCLYVCA